MNNSTFAPLLLALLLSTVAFVNVPPAPVRARQKNANAAPPPLLKRTATRRETKRLGHGGTLTLSGAPEGSVSVESWPRNEAEVVAEIEVSANTEEELARLAAVSGFLLESDFNRLGVTTVGTHDRKYMKRVARDFPKKLLTMPWRADYRLRVPSVVDLEIATG
jgi:hypothetical protein